MYFNNSVSSGYMLAAFTADVNHWSIEKTFMFIFLFQLPHTPEITHDAHV